MAAPVHTLEGNYSEGLVPLVCADNHLSGDESSAHPVSTTLQIIWFIAVAPLEIGIGSPM